jgi:hypothetical protein
MKQLITKIIFFLFSGLIKKNENVFSLHLEPEKLPPAIGGLTKAKSNGYSSDVYK